jgi:tetratricopeptide (TPR) repeat protein
MPKAIKISEEELLQLRKYLSSRCQLEIADYTSSETLHHLLKKQGLILSISTIRRIFMVVDSRGTASRYSLDTLAQFLSFENWENFRQAVANLHEQGFYNYLMEYKDYNYLPEEFFQFIVKNFSFKHWEDVYKVKEFLHLVIQKRDLRLLDRFFETVEFNLERNNNRKWGMALNPLYKESKDGNQWIVEWVQSNLSQNLKLQTAIIEFYEGEDDLTGFYGDWLMACQHWVKKEHRLFSILLLIQKCLLSGDRDQAKSLFIKAESLKEYLQTKPINIHAMARFCALGTVLDFFKLGVPMYFRDIKDQVDRLNFVNTFCRLLWQFKDSVSFLDICHPNLLDLSNLDTIVDIVTANRLKCNTWLSLAINYFNKGEQDKARDYLLLINGVDNTTWNSDWLQHRYQILLGQLEDKG